MRQTLAWLSFAVFIVGGIMGGSYLILAGPFLLFPQLRELINLQVWMLFIVVPVAILGPALGAYLGALLWMAAGSVVFTRSEVRAIVFYGPTFPLERWLFERLFPLNPSRRRRRTR